MFPFGELKHISRYGVSVSHVYYTLKFFFL